MQPLKRLMVFIMVLCASTGARANWEMRADGDVRYTVSDWREHDAFLNVAGLSLRRTFADSRGDRFIFAGLLEAEHNFEEIMVHELYGRYKGPLGAWNLTAGRFELPYGLLPTFRTSRLLYGDAIPVVLGFDVDNGAMLSGIVGAWEYALSVTQGYGPHHLPDLSAHGLVVARTGWTLGETDENRVGLSIAVGRAAHMHERDHVVSRTVAGVDATVYLGQLIGRIQVDGGQMDGHALAAGFLAADYALFPRLDLNAAVTMTRRDAHNQDTWFLGVTLRPRRFTLRGGITYAYSEKPSTTIAVQAYRLFSASF